MNKDKFTNTIIEIVKIFKGKIENKIISTILWVGSTLVLAGITVNWWILGFNYLINNSRTNYDISTIFDVNYYLIFMGIGIDFVAIWFYFHSREKKKNKTMLQLRHSSIESVSYTKFHDDLSDYNIEPHNLVQTEEIKDLNELNLLHALREQEKEVLNIIKRLDGSDNIELSYCGLANVPLTFLIGYQIADKSDTSFFEYNRNQLRWERLKEKVGNYPSLLLTEDTTKQSMKDSEDVVIRIGVSYPIEDENEIKEIDLDNLNSYYLYLENKNPNAIVCMEQINQYKFQFSELLNEIRKTYPKLKRIHILCSSQPSLAYLLGSSISPRIFKQEFWVYNYKKGYNWAINLKEIGEKVDIKLMGVEKHEGLR